MLVLAPPSLASVVGLLLRHGAYDVESVSTTDEARRHIRTLRPHLLISDITSWDGDVALSDLSQDGTIPVIVLSRRGDLRMKLDAIVHGADDFVTLPLQPDELVIRTLALTRRVYGKSLPFDAAINVAGLEFDLAARSVRYDGTTVRVTAIEQALLYLLASAPGRTFSRDAILEGLWGADYAPESNLVDRHVHDLRAKLSENWRTPRVIETISGEGYRLLPPRTADQHARRLRDEPHS